MSSPGVTTIAHKPVIREVRMFRSARIRPWFYRVCDACNVADPTTHRTRKEAAGFRLPCDEGE